jgi:hypothetical protein
MNAAVGLRLATVTLVLAAAPALASCGVSFDAQTNQVYTPAEGSNNRDGSVYVIHALVVSQADGSGTVVATLVNTDADEPDSLTGVEGAGDDSDLTVSLGDANAEIPPEGSLELGETGHVTVSGDAVVPGEFVRLVFTFEGGEAAELNVPVVAATGEYEGLDTSGSQGAGATPDAGATDQPSADQPSADQPSADQPSAEPTDEPSEEAAE